MPIIPPNNTTGLYGVDTTVQINNNIFGNNLVLTGNAVVGGTISATGNIITSSYFVGNFDGNITGNIAAAGSNTQVQYNNNGVLGAESTFTYDSATNTMSVPTVNTGVVRNDGNANVIVRNLAAVNDLNGNAVYLDSNNVFVGNTGNRARLNAASATDLQIVGAGGSGVPEITLVQRGGSGIFGNTGNIDVRSASTPGGGGFSAIGNINLAGNVYIGQYGTQVVAGTYGNLQVDGNIRSSTNISAVGNITGGNVIGTYLWGDGSNITGVVGGSETVQIPVKNTSGGTLAKGTPVYATGTVGATDTLEVSASRADTAATMPCVGLLETALNNNATGYAISVGHLGGVNTGSYTVGQTLYVAATGGLTNVRPNDGYLVQPIGTVGRVNASTGSIEVNSWNYFQLPNLGDGNIWIGNSTQIPNQTNLSTYTGNIGAGNISAGNITVGNTGGNVPGSVTIVSGNTVNKGRLISTYISAESDSGEVTFIKPSSGFGSADGNIVAGNIQSLGQLSVSGNVVVVNRVVGAALEAYAANVSQNFIVSTSTGVPVTTTTGTISAAGNITGNYFIGNGSALTGIVATASPAGANTQLQFNDGGVTGASANLTFDKVTNVLSTGVITATGNITGGNINTAGLITATGNITGSNITGSNIATSGLITATGNITGGNVNTAGLITATGNITGGNIDTAGLITATGNITGANLVASANLTSTQQTVVGTANVGTSGNIIVSGKNIATDMAWSPDGGNAATAATGRIVVGTGWNGNITHSAVQTRLVVSDPVTRTNTSSAVRSFNAEQFVTLAGNVTNTNFRQQTLGGQLRIGGGAAANTTSVAQGAGQVFTVSAGQFNLEIGNISPYFLGNTSLSQATVNGGALQIAAGSTVLNGYGIYNLIGAPVGVSPGNIGNVIGYSTSFALGTVPTGNVYGFYHPNATSGTTTGVTVTNQMRQAPQYYAFYNADDHAQMQLGSLKAYHEYRYSTATSGTVNIDKSNGQVQYIAPTGNVTIGTFSNFVTNTTDTSTTDYQVDTVTLIVEQGSTPYTITMPTGNTAIRYSGANSTVGSTANSTSMISITAYYSNAAAANRYVVTISPEFT